MSEMCMVKIISAEELRMMTTEELKLKLQCLGEAVHSIRRQGAFMGSAGTLDIQRPHIYRGHKKQIARIKTVLSQRGVKI